MLSAQSAVPSRHVTSLPEIVWCAEAEQPASEQARPVRIEHRAQPTTAEYRSHVSAEPDAAVLFQRPPPASSPFV
jgi:hypothetical protein